MKAKKTNNVNLYRRERFEGCLQVWQLRKDIGTEQSVFEETDFAFIDEVNENRE